METMDSPVDGSISFLFFVSATVASKSLADR